MEIQRILAMDIGTASIKAFLAELRGTDIVILNHGSLSSQGFKKGEIFDPILLQKKIEQTMECTKLAEDDRISAVIIGIGGMQLDVRSVQGSIAVKDGRVSDNDLRYVDDAAVLAALPEGAAVLERIPFGYRSDGQACQGSPVGVSAAVLECDCLLATIAQEWMDCLSKVFENAGIRPVYFVANVLAINAAADLPEPSYLLLDIGAGTVDFTICEAGNFIRAGSVPVGGEYITRDIVQSMELDFVHAERLKQYFSRIDPALRGQNIVLDCSDENILEKNVQFDFLYDIINNRVNELVDLLHGELAADLANREISCIYCTGGDAAFYPFVEAFTAKFNCEVRQLSLEKIPEQYRRPENMAAYSILQYVRLRFMQSLADKQQAELSEGQTKPQSFLHKIKSFLHL